MADWFKFYENDLDETRLQYAISKMPEVVSVWVGILSECCRHKSDTVRWGANEIELFGFSRRLGISIPKVNEAVNLLCEIDYIKRSGDALIVMKWGQKQSEYCQKKAKQMIPKSDTVPTLSGQYPPRGEERRLDKKENKASPLLVFPENLRTERVLNKWAIWMDFRRGKKKPSDWAVLFNGQIEWLSQFNEPKVFEILSASIRNGWQGLFETKENTKQPDKKSCAFQEG